MKKYKEKPARDFQLPSPDEVYDLIKRQKRPLKLDAIYRILHIPRQANRVLMEVLEELARNGKLIRLPGGVWVCTNTLKRAIGKFQSLGHGGGIVIPDSDKTEEIFIPAQHTGDAWHKDLVEVALTPGSHGRQGKILRVIERRQKEVTARIEKIDSGSILCKAADRRLKASFTVAMDSGAPIDKKLRPGLLVALQPAEKIGSDLWQASLINIFGAEDKIQVQESLVKANHQVPGEFPALALKQAAMLPSQPDSLDCAGREDMRAIPFVTIDGADARDFDDAIHVEKTPDGYILRVAIADVSYYVRPDKRDGSLDQEALKRGNSWYFPQSVEPMLPKTLSNGLCSLRPNEERLAMLVEMPFDMKGNPGKPRFAPVVMQSAGRLIYDDVARLFASNFRDTSGERPEIIAMLKDAFPLYKLLAGRRRVRGTLEFELPEPAYTFDENGRLERMGKVERNDAHLLIEEFMIAANEAVASFLEKKKIPFLYRCHPAPEPMKVEKLVETLASASLEILPADIKPEAFDDPKTFQRILAKAKGTPEDYVVNRLCLRSMSQARYQPENVGHFGLASKSYCHFTSPIRRYADLMTHRALKHCLGQPEPIITDSEILAETGEDLNKTERAALECEREMARRMGCLAMKEHEGESFSGVISGVTDFGLFVELDEIPTEGMIRLESLGNDWFNLDQTRQMLVGERTGTIWRLGQPIKVKVNSVDLDRLEIRLIPRLPEALGTRQIQRKSAHSAPRRQQRKDAPKTKSRPQSPKNQRRGANKSGNGRTRP